MNSYPTSSLRKIPESIGNLHELISLNLKDCSQLVSLPQSIGKLSKLTSLNVEGCYNLISLPASIGNLTNINSELKLGDYFTIPSDIDWSQFHQNVVTIPLYWEYMMKMKQGWIYILYSEGIYTDIRKRVLFQREISCERCNRIDQRKEGRRRGFD